MQEMLSEESSPTVPEATDWTGVRTLLYIGRTHCQVVQEVGGLQLRSVTAAHTGLQCSLAHANRFPSPQYGPQVSGALAATFLLLAGLP